MTARVVIDTAAVQRYASAGGGPVVRDLSERMARVEAGALRQVGRKTGALARSKAKTVSAAGGRVKVTLGFYAPHALMHHQGTPPHLIVPRQARVLAFPGRGGTVFAMRVRHPGTRPNKFLVDNLHLAGGRTRIG